jgi:hypothetical protein
MNRETDWHVFDKAVELTAMAVRGTAAGGAPAEYVADLFREVHRALTETAEAMQHSESKTGF